MKRIATALAITALVLFFTGCSKDINNSESDLYGSWAKGAAFGDTIVFMRKNDKNIMRHSMSVNPAMPMIAEGEYTYRNGKLRVKLFAPTSQDYFMIDSFNWISIGHEFTLQSIDLYPFMSSIQTFTFHKL